MQATFPWVGPGLHTKSSAATRSSQGCTATLAALSYHQPPGQLVSSLCLLLQLQQLSAPACSVQLQFSSVEKSKTLGMVPVSYF